MRRDLPGPVEGALMLTDEKRAEIEKHGRTIVRYDIEQPFRLPIIAGLAGIMVVLTAIGIAISIYWK
jgi:hypothetical protein